MPKMAIFTQEIENVRKVKDIENLMHKQMLKRGKNCAVCMQGTGGHGSRSVM